MIFRQGEPARREVYLVHEGTVEVKSRVRGEEHFLRSLGKGELLGEVAFLREGAHSATVVALEPVMLLVIPADRLERIVRTNPELAIALIRQLARMADVKTTPRETASWLVHSALAPPPTSPR